MFQNPKHHKAKLLLYTESRRQAKKIIHKNKRDYHKTKVSQIEELSISNETRTFYRAVKYMNHGFLPKIDECKDKTGRIVEDEKVINRWQQYFNSFSLTAYQVKKRCAP